MPKETETGAQGEIGIRRKKYFPASLPLCIENLF